MVDNNLEPFLIAEKTSGDLGHGVTKSLFIYYDFQLPREPRHSFVTAIFN
jgi:hypothetical protein